MLHLCKRCISYLDNKFDTSYFNYFVCCLDDELSATIDNKSLLLLPALVARLILLDKVTEIAKLNWLSTCYHSSKSQPYSVLCKAVYCS